MNYFSHFIFDHIPLNHDYNTGLLLPDITRKKITKFNYDVNMPSEFSDLFLGCKRHYESDKKFHSSNFFHQHYNHLNHLISHSNYILDVERKWFISHIILELLIDRIFVKHQRSLLDNFYLSLIEVDEMKLRTYLKFFGMENIDEFFVFFNHFRSSQYIYHYTDNNKFMYSLNRIMMRANVKPLTQKNSDLILDVILEFEKTYFDQAESIMNEMKILLK